eukprot:2436757-Pleurochrysis_carterae.AAC.4
MPVSISCHVSAPVTIPRNPSLRVDSAHSLNCAPTACVKASCSASSGPRLAPVDQKKQTATTSVRHKMWPPTKQTMLARLSGKMQ